MIPCHLFNSAHDILNTNCFLKSAYYKYLDSVKFVQLKKIQLRFLKDCLDNRICPTSLLKNELISYEGVPFSDAAQEVLRIKISVIKNEVNRLYQFVRNNFNTFQLFYTNCNLPSSSVCVLLDYCFAYAKSKNSYCEYNLNRKFKLIFEKSTWKNFSNFDLIVNHSSYELNIFEKTILGFGLSFGFDFGSDSLLKFIANYNKFLKHTNLVDMKDIEYASVAKGFILSEIINGKKNQLPKLLIDALLRLKKNNDIIICKADKGNKIVLMNKDDYFRKSYELLNDDSVYKKLTSNPLKTTQSRFNQTLKCLLHNNPNLIKRFLSYMPRLSYFYGLPKIHKLQIPLRPIISNVNSITYNLAKWLTQILSPVVGKISGSHIKNSVEFVDRIRGVNLCHKSLVSFDVVSLFTKVPLDLLLPWLREYFENTSFQLPINIDSFLDLIKLCISCSHFSFNNEYFTQISGLSMGSPLSPILSNIFMELFEVKFLPGILPNDSIWLRYVDDVLAILPSDFSAVDALAYLNDCVPDIKFTLESESNLGLPFLDVLIMRELNGFPTFKIYRKNTHVDSYVHWFSNHPRKVKRRIIMGFFLRAHKICSPLFLDEEISYINNVFKKLAYPSHFIDSALSDCRKKFHSQSSNTFNKNNILVLPTSTPKIDLLLRPSISVVTSGQNNVGRFVRNNCQDSEVSAGVYKIPCRDCNLLYIGETNDFKRRIYQHEYALRTGDCNSSLLIHRERLNHRISTNDASLILKSDSAEERALYEAFAINNVNNFNVNKNNFIDNFTNNILLNFSKLSTFIKNLNDVT